MERTKLDMTPATINALHDAIGALVFAISYELPVETRASLAQALGRHAQSKNRAGNHLAATLLIDYATAAELAAKA